jgi:hypothetical protein
MVLNVNGIVGRKHLGSKGGPPIYRAFGMNIDSGIDLPELRVAEGVPDVRVVYGKTPQEIPGALARRRRYQAAPDRFLFQVEGVGRYYVADGECIVVEPLESAEAKAVRLFLLGTTFGSLLLQRGILPIHGSAVVIDGRGVILTGVSGAGKSTLLAAFRKRGAAFLTDDVAAVTVDGSGVPWVHPGYPQQKLWRDSAVHMGVDVSDCLPIRSGVDKYAVAAEEGFCQTPARLVAVCELRPENRPEADLTRLTGPDKLAVLLRHTYRKWLLAGMGLKERHFRQCVDVARSVAVSRLARPNGGYSAVQQADLVDRLMTELVAVPAG